MCGLRQASQVGGVRGDHLGSHLICSSTHPYRVKASLGYIVQAGDVDFGLTGQTGEVCVLQSSVSR